MNQEFKEKLIEALQSGKYSKGKGALRRGDDFCCLGVACDLLNPNGWGQICPDKRVVWGNDELGLVLNFLPRNSRIETEIGLSQGEQHQLAALNDDSDTFDPVIEYLRTL